MKGWLFIALLLCGSIVSLTGLRQIFVDPLDSTGTNLAWLVIQLIPLLVPLPGLLQAQLRSTFIMCMTSTLYFIHGVVIVADPGKLWLGSLEIIFSLALCAVTALLVRKIREQEAQG